MKNNLIVNDSSTFGQMIQKMSGNSKNSIVFISVMGAGFVEAYRKEWERENAIMYVYKYSICLFIIKKEGTFVFN